jgi:hypothetical protein
MSVVSGEEVHQKPTILSFSCRFFCDREKELWTFDGGFYDVFITFVALIPDTEAIMSNYKSENL